MAKIENISKAFAWGLPAAAGFGAVLLATPVAAQVTPTGGTSVAPVSGVPVITIVAPTANGVSHNTYTQFNAGTEGLVLNNCATAGGCGNSAIITGTSLGANANFGSGPANLILNEVNGSASLLLGKIETYGHAADFVLANPAGVTCDGCGFINTPRATLTTGTPSVDGSGNVSFSVTGSNNVTIGSGGADISGLTYFDVIASSIALQGKIGTPGATGSGEIGLFTGSNFDYGTRTVSGSTATAPTVAIDSAALGGAYANKIQLISTQSGAGVNTPDLQAGAGGIKLSADGKITVGNSSQGQQTQSQGGIDITTSSGGDAVIANTVSTAGGLTLTAAGALTVNSGVTANSGTGTTIFAGTAGTPCSSSACFSNSGTLSSQGAVDVTTYAGDLANTNGGLISGKTLKLAAAATLSNSLNSKLTSNTSITIDAQSLNNDSTSSIAANGGAVTAGQLGTLAKVTNDGIIAGQTVAMTASGAFDNTGTIGFDSSSNLTSSSTNLTAGSFTNSGTVTSNGATGITATAGDLTNSNSISGQSVTATASNVLSNSAQITANNGDLKLSAAQAKNGGTFNAVNGAVTATITASAGKGDGSFDNTGTIGVDPSTKLASASNTTLTANSFTNSGIVSSKGATNVATTSGGLINSGSISGQSLNANAASDLSNTGTITAQQDASIKVGGTLTNGDLTTPVNATIHAGGTLNIQAGALKNYGDADIFKTRGEISGMYLNIVTGGDMQNMGNLFATQDMTIKSQGNITNGFGWIKAGGYLSITAAGDFNNVAGLIQASSMNVSAQTSENVVLVRPDDELLLPKKRGNVIRPAERPGYRPGHRGLG